MAGAQLNNIQILDLTTGLTRTLETGGTPDILQIETDLQLLTGANLLVDGNLVVNGTTTTLNTEQVNVRDNHLYLNADYTTAAAQTGGFVVNVLPTATNDTVAAGGFTAGVPATSNPEVTTAVGGVFSAGDIVQISGANNQVNDGLYEVESHVGTTLVVRGVGLVANTQDWFSNDFETDSTAAGTITLVNVNVLRGTSTGVWETFTGNSTTGLTYQEFTTQGAVDLQSAYEEGNQITTDAGNGNVVISGTELLQVTAAGGIDLNTVFDFDGTSFDVQMTGANGFSIDGGAASNVSVDSGDLNLSATTTGSVLVDGVDGVEINSTGGALSIGNDADAQDINVGTGAAARTITVGNATGATAVDFDAGTGAFSFDSTVDESTAIMAWTTTGAGGDSVEMFVGGLDPSAGGGVAAPVGSIYHRDVGNAGTAGEVYIKTGAAATAWDLVGTGGGNSLQQAYVQGNTIVTDTTNGDLDVSGTEAISLDAQSASNFTVDGADLTLSTTTSGNLDIQSAGVVDMDSTGSTTITATGGSATLETVTSGNVIVRADGNTFISTNDNAVATPGFVQVSAGNATGGNNTGGSLFLRSGSGEGTGNGAPATLQAGNSGAGATGNGGFVTIIGGDATSTSGDAGGITLSLGTPTGAGSASEVEITGPNNQDDVLVSLETTGTGGDSVGLFVGTSDPSGVVTADAGSLFFRDEGTTGELYLNTSTGSGTAWEQVSTGGSIDLQTAYENGNTIVTDTTNGDFDVSGTEAISLDAGAASNFTVDSATLTLQTVTSGNLAIASADNVIVNAQDILADATSSISLDAVDVSNFTVSGNSAGATDLTLSASNAGAGTASVLITADNEVDITSASLIDINAAGDLDVDVTGNVTFDSSGSFSADAVGASNVTTDSGALTLSTTTSGTINVDGVGGVEINSTGGFLGLGNDADAQDILIGTGAAARTITVGNSTGATALEFNAGTGAHVFSSTVPETTALVTLTTTGAGGDSVGLFVGDNDPSGTVSADAGSLFFRDEGTTGELYLNTSTGSGTTWSQISTGDTTETLQEAYEAGNTIVTDSTNGDFDVSGTEAISLDAQSASNFTVDGASLTLSTTTSGTLDLTSADDIQMTFETNNATAMVIDDGTNNFMTFDSTTGDLAVEVNQFLDITGSGSGITLTANATIAAGDVVTIEGTSGDVILADSNTGTTIDGLAIGIAATAATASNPVKVYTVPGSLVPVNFAAAPAAAQNGRPVYVSQTAGEGTLTAPTGSGNVVYVIGILQGADGVTTSPNVVYQPQFISLRP